MIVLFLLTIAGILYLANRIGKFAFVRRLAKGKKKISTLFGFLLRSGKSPDRCLFRFPYRNHLPRGGICRTYENHPGPEPGCGCEYLLVDIQGK